MEWEFSSTIIEWRGPPPYLFAPTPPEVSQQIRDNAKQLSYGWGCIPVIVTVGQSSAVSALFPRENGYLIPIKVAIQKAEQVSIDDEIHIRLAIDFSRL